MPGFSAEWLALREPCDHAARDAELTGMVARRVSEGARPVAVDLACGTGSNARYLMPRMPSVRHWVLVDHDQDLLRRAERLLAPLAERQGVTIEARHLDLADLGRLPLEDCGLVTASAWLDLVSDDWLRALADRCREAGAHVLFPLNYDGRLSCTPNDADDEWIRALVNRHQRTDKGLGPALGPDATGAAERAFDGWEAVALPSDWRLQAGTEAVQRELVNGWAAAARDIAADEAAAIDAWRTRRLAWIAEGVSHLVVGHLDFAAWSR